MRTFTNEETRRLLATAPLALELERALAELEAGQIRAPLRGGMDTFGGGGALWMPAAASDLVVCKLLTWHPAAPARGYPRSQGVLVVFSTLGVPLLVLDGAAVTQRRTAVLSLLAASRLAPAAQGPLLLVGTGAQAQAHLEAFGQGLGNCLVREVYVHGRDPDKVRAMLTRGWDLGIDMHPVERVDDALAQCNLVVTATTSPSPILPAELTSRHFVAAIGAYKPNQAELPPQVFAGAEVVVDQLEAARAEAGDLIMAVEAGYLSWESVRPLSRALREERPNRGPVIFKSVGHAAFDLAAARVALAQIASS
jgi:ornithine cyclodeaminase